MATEVKLPDIGEGVTEGELVKWLVAVGDSVDVDQPVAEVMTDKATVEVPTPIAGKVIELKAEEGDIIPIETTMLLVDGAGAGASPSPAPATKEEPAVPVAMHAVASAPAPQPTVATGGGGGMEVYPPPASTKVLATPATRRLAREMNVDINNISGTGNAGRVTREDVMGQSGNGAAPQPRSAPSAPTTPAFKDIPAPAYNSPAGAVEERVPLRGIRRKIAQQMQMTKSVVPHFTLMDEANVTQLVKMRGEAKKVGEQYGVKVTFLPFIMKALIATAREFPMFNASIDDANEEIVYKKYFNIGFAADTPNGLLVPVVKNADQKSILQISKEIMDLAGRARDGKLALDEMKDATMTITNIGSVGGTYATPIINHPEVAIFGVYKIQDKPIFVNEKFRAAKVQNYTTTCDHRLIDGAVAANFMKAFLNRIENPSALMLDMV